VSTTCASPLTERLVITGVQYDVRRCVVDLLWAYCLVIIKSLYITISEHELRPERSRSLYHVSTQDAAAVGRRAFNGISRSVITTPIMMAAGTLGARGQLESQRNTQTHSTAPHVRPRANARRNTFPGSQRQDIITRRIECFEESEDVGISKNTVARRRGIQRAVGGATDDK